MAGPVIPPAGPYVIYMPFVAGNGSGPAPRTIDYEYDPLYRLTSADYSSGEYFHYTYDAVGDRLSQETEQGSNAYSYDVAHRLIEVDGQSYTWDDNGNLLDDGVRSFTYDHADRLIAVSGQPSAFSFGYDGMGNRYQQTQDAATTTFSLDLAAGLTQVLSDGSNASLYGLGRIGEDGSGGWGYHLGDALGSVRQITNDSGQLTLAQSFEPFGAPMASAGEASSGFGFTGEQDAAGLVFLRARFYDPTVGRFLTKDPFPGHASSPSTLNPYTYALNNPGTFVDPSGRNPLLIAAAIGAIIGGVAGGISYAFSHPGQSLGDLFSSSCFWLEVGVGLFSGGVAGIVGYFMPGILGFFGLNIQASLGAAILGGGLTGAFASGLGKIASNLITGQDWKAELGSAMLFGFIAGAIAGGLGFKIRQTYLRKQLLAFLSAGEKGEGITVIGKDPVYLTVAKEWNANALNVPAEEFERIIKEGGGAAWWAINRAFLDEAIERGDVFLLASPFKLGWAEVSSFFKSELEYIVRKGYKIIEVFGNEWMVPGSW